MSSESRLNSCGHSIQDYMGSAVTRTSAASRASLEVILWALRGRCGLQPDVRAWMRTVQLDFMVDDEQMIADLRGGRRRPAWAGAFWRKSCSTTFNGQEAFEAAMDEVMMPRLGLTAIPACKMLLAVRAGRRLRTPG